MKPNLMKLILYINILSGLKTFFTNNFPHTQNVLNLYKGEVVTGVRKVNATLLPGESCLLFV